MLSRVAERVYWMTRYLERTENTARLLKAYFLLHLDLPREWSIGWETPLKVTATDELYKQRYKRLQEQQVIKFMISDLDNPNSLISSIHHARENIRTTREILPSETWEIINELYAFSKSKITTAIVRHGRYEYLEKVIGNCQQITGLFAGIMTQDLAYQFMRMGRNLERADMTTRVIDIGADTLMFNAKKDSPYIDLIWVTLLRSLNGFQMYRQSLGKKATAAPIIEFLITNKLFPRAVAHCLNEVEACVLTIKKNKSVLASVNKTIKHTTSFDKNNLDYKQLHKFLDQTQLNINNLHSTISKTWFIIS